MPLRTVGLAESFRDGVAPPSRNVPRPTSFDARGRWEAGWPHDWGDGARMWPWRRWSAGFGQRFTGSVEGRPSAVVGLGSGHRLGRGAQKVLARWTEAPCGPAPTTTEGRSRPPTSTRVTPVAIAAPPPTAKRSE